MLFYMILSYIARRHDMNYHMQNDMTSLND